MEGKGYTQPVAVSLDVCLCTTAYRQEERVEYNIARGVEIVDGESAGKREKAFKRHGDLRPARTLATISVNMKRRVNTNAQLQRYPKLKGT